MQPDRKIPLIDAKWYNECDRTWFFRSVLTPIQELFKLDRMKNSFVLFITSISREYWFFIRNLTPPEWRVNSEAVLQLLVSNEIFLSLERINGQKRIWKSSFSLKIILPWESIDYNWPTSNCLRFMSSQWKGINFQWILAEFIASTKDWIFS